MRSPKKTPVPFSRLTSTTTSSMPGTMLKSGAIAGRAAIDERRIGHGPAHVGDRGQRHDGVAEPVGSEDDETGHGGFTAPRGAAPGPHVRLK